MDISGETQRDLTHNILKARLDQQGKLVAGAGSYSADLQNDLDKMNSAKAEGYCGSCYGGIEPEGGCCNTCEEVRTAYVNRGWSFSNPDAIEQVRLTAFVLRRTTNYCSFSVNPRDGRTSSATRLTRAATFPVAFASIRSSVTFTCLRVARSRRALGTSMSWYHT